jgi:radical SAM protein with 4Fe4S-binding SPASM domain
MGLSYLLSIVGQQKTAGLSPTFLSVETSNYCNLHCPECPVGTGQNPKLGQAKFDLTLYKKLIDEQKPTVQHVILYFQGEPLLNKQLPEFIEYAHRARIYTSTSTNGQLLNKKNAKDIVLSGLDKLIISVDGSTQETYESYRKGGKLQKTLDGIQEIVFWKNELKSATPLLEIQFIVLKTNEHQLQDMKKLAKSLHADRLTFKTAQLYDFENGNKLLTTIDKYARYKQLANGKYAIKSNQPNRCGRLWGGAVVNARGEVLPCCFDKSSEYSFGNINNQSFSDCWHSKKASDFRASILQNRKRYEMCRNCTSR